MAMMEEPGGMDLPPPSPLTGCYLLIVVGEPHTWEHKEVILQRIKRGLRSWDSGEFHVDLEKELATIVAAAPEGENARNGERLIQFASENLVTEILIHPQMNTLMQCMRNMLSSFTRHRQLVHSGYTYQGNGSWIMQDGTFSVADFEDAFQENEVQRVIRAYENTISINVMCSGPGAAHWSQLTQRTTLCHLRINPDETFEGESQAINDFVAYLEPYIVPASLEQLLVSSDVVGNIRFSHPTLYIFPGGQGDAALFGINGFNMLVDGGFARKACWWEFVRHLDRLDAVMLTRLNSCSIAGMAAVIQRKVDASVYPQIGHFFCNLEERQSGSSQQDPEDKDYDPLQVSLHDEGSSMMANLRSIKLKAQPCHRSNEPINLYHKVGHGTLDMYVLNPEQDSRHVKEFLEKWHSGDSAMFSSRFTSRRIAFPVPNLVSICALLIWRPADPDAQVTRLMFPGSTPQHKIFEGLERLQHLKFLQQPTCTSKQLDESLKKKENKSRTSHTRHTTRRYESKHGVDKYIQQSDLNSKNTIDNKLINEFVDSVEDNKMKSMLENRVRTETIGKIEAALVNESRKIENIDLTSQDKKQLSEILSSGKKLSETKKLSQKKMQKNDMMQIEMKSRISKSDKKSLEMKLEQESVRKSVQSNRISSESRRESEEKKSPTTPKKSAIEIRQRDVKKKKNLSKDGADSDKKDKPPNVIKKSPSRMPAKSAKEETNRKVALLKSRSSPRQPVQPKPIEKKEIKSKREPISRRPKPISSPVKTLRTSKSPSKKMKTDLKKVVTDDDIVKKSDEETSKSIDETKQDFDEREEQEIVKEIEAVFNRDRLTDDRIDFVGRSEIEKIATVVDVTKTDIILDEEFEEEYLIIEKEEVEHFTEDSIERVVSNKEEELQKHLRDIKESEKRLNIDDSVQNEEKIVSKEDTKEIKDMKTKSSPETGIMVESLPEEKASTTFESGATTAPTLPEDERFPTEDHVKDDIIEEKYIKEETKEKPDDGKKLHLVNIESINLKNKELMVVRDIVKTPDEVADLPLHEEVEYNNDEGERKKVSAADELDVFKIKPGIGFVREVEVPSNLSIEKPEAETDNQMEDKVVLGILQGISHAEIVTVTPGSGPDSPLMRQIKENTTKHMEDDNYEYTSALRETHITTTDSPNKEEKAVIDDQGVSEKIAAIPEEGEKEVEEYEKDLAPPDDYTIKRLSPVDIEKIVVNVAEVLKSDKSLEEIMNVKGNQSDLNYDDEICNEIKRAQYQKQQESAGTVKGEESSLKTPERLEEKIAEMTDIIVSQISQKPVEIASVDTESKLESEYKVEEAEKERRKILVASVIQDEKIVDTVLEKPPVLLNTQSGEKNANEISPIKEMTPLSSTKTNKDIMHENISEKAISSTIFETGNKVNFEPRKEREESPMPPATEISCTLSTLFGAHAEKADKESTEKPSTKIFSQNISVIDDRNENKGEEKKRLVELFTTDEIDDEASHSSTSHHKIEEGSQILSVFSTVEPEKLEQGADTVLQPPLPANSESKESLSVSTNEVETTPHSTKDNETRLSDAALLENKQEDKTLDHSLSQEPSEKDKKYQSMVSPIEDESLEKVSVKSLSPHPLEDDVRKLSVVSIRDETDNKASQQSTQLRGESPKPSEKSPLSHSESCTRKLSVASLPEEEKDEKASLKSISTYTTDKNEILTTASSVVDKKQSSGLEKSHSPLLTENDTRKFSVASLPDEEKDEKLSLPLPTEKDETVSSKSPSPIPLEEKNRKLSTASTEGDENLTKESVKTSSPHVLEDDKRKLLAMAVCEDESDGSVSRKKPSPKLEEENKKILSDHQIDDISASLEKSPSQKLVDDELIKLTSKSEKFPSTHPTGDDTRKLSIASHLDEDVSSQSPSPKPLEEINRKHSTASTEGVDDNMSESLEKSPTPQLEEDETIKLTAKSEKSLSTYPIGDDTRKLSIASHLDEDVSSQSPSPKPLVEINRKHSTTSTEGVDDNISESLEKSPTPQLEEHETIKLKAKSEESLSTHPTGDDTRKLSIASHLDEDVSSQSPSPKPLEEINRKHSTASTEGVDDNISKSLEKSPTPQLVEDDTIKLTAKSEKSLSTHPTGDDTRKSSITSHLDEDVSSQSPSPKPLEETNRKLSTASTEGDEKLEKESAKTPSPHALEDDKSKLSVVSVCEDETDERASHKTPSPKSEEENEMNLSDHLIHDKNFKSLEKSPSQQSKEDEKNKLIAKSTGEDQEQEKREDTGKLLIASHLDDKDQNLSSKLPSPKPLEEINRKLSTASTEGDKKIEEELVNTSPPNVLEDDKRKISVISVCEEESDEKAPHKTTSPKSDEENKKISDHQVDDIISKSLEKSPSPLPVDDEIKILTAKLSDVDQEQELHSEKSPSPHPTGHGTRKLSIASHLDEKDDNLPSKSPSPKPVDEINRKLSITSTKGDEILEKEAVKISSPHTLEDDKRKLSVVSVCEDETDGRASPKTSSPKQNKENNRKLSDHLIDEKISKSSEKSPSPQPVEDEINILKTNLTDVDQQLELESEKSPPPHLTENGTRKLSIASHLDETDDNLPSKSPSPKPVEEINRKLSITLTKGDEILEKEAVKISSPHTLEDDKRKLSVVSVCEDETDVKGSPKMSSPKQDEENNRKLSDHLIDEKIPKSSQKSPSPQPVEDEIIILFTKQTDVDQQLELESEKSPPPHPTEDGTRKLSIASHLDVRDDNLSSTSPSPKPVEEINRKLSITSTKDDEILEKEAVKSSSPHNLEDLKRMISVGSVCEDETDVKASPLTPSPNPDEENKRKLSDNLIDEKIASEQSPSPLPVDNEIKILTAKLSDVDQEQELDSEKSPSPHPTGHGRRKLSIASHLDEKDDNLPSKSPSPKPVDEINRKLSITSTKDDEILEKEAVKISSPHTLEDDKRKLSVVFVCEDETDGKASPKTSSPKQNEENNRKLSDHLSDEKISKSSEKLPSPQPVEDEIIILTTKLTDVDQQLELESEKSPPPHPTEDRTRKLSIASHLDEKDDNLPSKSPSPKPVEEINRKLSITSTKGDEIQEKEAVKLSSPHTLEDDKRKLSVVSVCEDETDVKGSPKTSSPKQDEENNRKLSDHLNDEKISKSSEKSSSSQPVENEIIILTTKITDVDQQLELESEKSPPLHPTEDVKRKLSIASHLDEKDDNLPSKSPSPKPVEEINRKLSITSTKDDEIVKKEAVKLSSPHTLEDVKRKISVGSVCEDETDVKASPPDEENKRKLSDNPIDEKISSEKSPSQLPVDTENKILTAKLSDVDQEQELDSEKSPPPHSTGDGTRKLSIASHLDEKDDNLSSTSPSPKLVEEINRKLSIKPTKEDKISDKEAIKTSSPHTLEDNKRKLSVVSVCEDKADVKASPLPPSINADVENKRKLSENLIEEKISSEKSPSPLPVDNEIKIFTEKLTDVDQEQELGSKKSPSPHPTGDGTRKLSIASHLDEKDNNLSSKSPSPKPVEEINRKLLITSTKDDEIPDKESTATSSPHTLEDDKRKLSVVSVSEDETDVKGSPKTSSPKQDEENNRKLSDNLIAEKISKSPEKSPLPQPVEDEINILTTKLTDENQQLESEKSHPPHPTEDSTRKLSIASHLDEKDDKLPSKSPSPKPVEEINRKLSITSTKDDEILEKEAVKSSSPHNLEDVKRKISVGSVCEDETDVKASPPDEENKRKLSDNPIAETISSEKSPTQLPVDNEIKILKAKLTDVYQEQELDSEKSPPPHPTGDGTRKLSIASHLDEKDYNLSSTSPSPKPVEEINRKLSITSTKEDEIPDKEAIKTSSPQTVEDDKRKLSVVSVCEDKTDVKASSLTPSPNVDVENKKKLSDDLIDEKISKSSEKSRSPQPVEDEIIILTDKLTDVDQDQELEAKKLPPPHPTGDVKRKSSIASHSDEKDENIPSNPPSSIPVEEINRKLSITSTKEDDIIEEESVQTSSPLTLRHEKRKLSVVSVCDDETDGKTSPKTSSPKQNEENNRKLSDHLIDEKISKSSEKSPSPQPVEDEIIILTTKLTGVDQQLQLESEKSHPPYPTEDSTRKLSIASHLDVRDDNLSSTSPSPKPVEEINRKLSITSTKDDEILEKEAVKSSSPHTLEDDKRKVSVVSVCEDKTDVKATPLTPSPKSDEESKKKLSDHLIDEKISKSSEKSRSPQPVQDKIFILKTKLTDVDQDKEQESQKSPPPHPTGDGTRKFSITSHLDEIDENLTSKSPSPKPVEDINRKLSITSTKEDERIEKKSVKTSSPHTLEDEKRKLSVMSVCEDDTDKKASQKTELSDHLINEKIPRISEKSPSPQPVKAEVVTLTAKPTGEDQKQELESEETLSSHRTEDNTSILSIECHLDEKEEKSSHRSPSTEPVENKSRILLATSTEGVEKPVRESATSSLPYRLEDDKRKLSIVSISDEDSDEKASHKSPLPESMEEKSRKLSTMSTEENEQHEEGSVKSLSPHPTEEESKKLSSVASPSEDNNIEISSNQSLTPHPAGEEIIRATTLTTGGDKKQEIEIKESSQPQPIEVDTRESSIASFLDKNDEESSRKSPSPKPEENSQRKFSNGSISGRKQDKVSPSLHSTEDETSKLSFTSPLEDKKEEILSKQSLTHQPTEEEIKKSTNLTSVGDKKVMIEIKQLPSPPPLSNDTTEELKKRKLSTDSTKGDKQEYSLEKPPSPHPMEDDTIKLSVESLVKDEKYDLVNKEMETENASSSYPVKDETSKSSIVSLLDGNSAKEPHKTPTSEKKTKRKLSTESTDEQDKMSEKSACSHFTKDSTRKLSVASLIKDEANETNASQKSQLPEPIEEKSRKLSTTSIEGAEKLEKESVKAPSPHPIKDETRKLSVASPLEDNKDEILSNQSLTTQPTEEEIIKSINLTIDYEKKQVIEIKDLPLPHPLVDDTRQSSIASSLDENNENEFHKSPLPFEEVTRKLSEASPLEKQEVDTNMVLVRSIKLEDGESIKSATGVDNTKYSSSQPLEFQSIEKQNGHVPYDIIHTSCQVESQSSECNITKQTHDFIHEERAHTSNEYISASETFTQSAHLLSLKNKTSSESTNQETSENIQQGIKTENLETVSGIERSSTPSTAPVSPLLKMAESGTGGKVCSDIEKSDFENLEESVIKIVQVGEDILTQKISTSTEKLSHEGDLSDVSSSLSKLKTETDTFTKVVNDGENLLTQTITTVTAKDITSIGDGTPQDFRTTIETTTLSKSSEAIKTLKSDSQTIFTECSSSLKSSSSCDNSSETIPNKSPIETCMDQCEILSDTKSNLETKLSQDCQNQLDIDESIEDTTIDTDVRKKVIKENGADVVQTITTITKKEVLLQDSDKKTLRTTIETTTVNEYPNGSSSIQKDVSVKTEEISLREEQEDLLCKGLDLIDQSEENLDTIVRLVSKDDLQLKETIDTQIVKSTYSNKEATVKKIKTVTILTTTQEYPDGSTKVFTERKVELVNISNLPVRFDSKEKEDIYIKDETKTRKQDLKIKSSDLNLDSLIVADKDNQPSVLKRSPIGEITKEVENFTKIVGDGDKMITQNITVVTTKEVITPDKVKITVETTTVSKSKDGITKTTKSTKTTISEFSEQFEETIDNSACDVHADFQKDSRIAGFSEKRRDSFSDDDGPESPSSTKSQHPHSPRSNLSFDMTDQRDTTNLQKSFDPMTTSFYGELPGDFDSMLEFGFEKATLSSDIQTKTISENIHGETHSQFLEEAERHFEESCEQYKKAVGENVISTVSSKYEISSANSKSSSKDTKETIFKLQKQTKDERESKTLGASESHKESESKDPIETWGKPLGLPSPAGPPDNRGTPKKQNSKTSRVRSNESPSKTQSFTPVYMDLTYVPHHGNSYYSAVEFFKRVRARYYVFSGTEPSKEIYNALLDAKKTWEDENLEVTIIPTYDTDVLGYWVTENEEALERYKIDLSPSASRCTINLQDHETSCAAYRLEF